MGYAGSWNSTGNGVRSSLTNTTDTGRGRSGNSSGNLNPPTQMTTWLNTGTPHGCEPSIDAVEAKDEAFRILTRKEPFKWTLRRFLFVARGFLYGCFLVLGIYAWVAKGDTMVMTVLFGLCAAGEFVGNILHRAAECDRKLLKLTMDLKALHAQDEHKTALMEQIIAEDEVYRILMLDLEPGDRLQHKHHPFDVHFDGFISALDVKSGMVVSKDETHAVVNTPVNLYPITLPEFWREFDRYDGSRSQS